MKRKSKPAALSASTIMKLDQITSAQFKIPTLLLMENAGRSVAEEAKKIMSKKGSVLILCGSGNNGGDGFAAARHLTNAGVSVNIWIIGRPERFKPDTVANYQMMTAMGIPFKLFDADLMKNFMKDLKSSKLIIDALFGVGLSRNLEEPYISLVDLVNKAKKRVLSIDLPSGLHADTGNVMGKCIRAHTTVTLAALKPGLYVNEGPAHAGKIKIADISIPKVLIEKALHGKI